MRLLRLMCLVLCGAAAYVVLPQEASAVNFPSAACNGGGCGGWFRSNVTVTWSIDPGSTSSSGCGAAVVAEDTGGATFTCSATYPGGTVSASVTVQKDSSPPSVNASVARDPDGNGWYTKPVSFTFSGDGGPSGIGSCTSGTYGGPDGGAVTISGTCTDGAGNSASSSFGIKYDATPPEVTVAAERPPDAEGGWYNHPVKVAFTGKDGGSGVAECTQPVTYAGPDANPAKVVGQCRDTAGHVSSVATLEMRYDGTKPAPPNVKSAHRGTAITLSWTRPAEVVRSEVVRGPGVRNKKPAVVFNGTRNTLVDRKIKPGTRYWYEVRLYDQAGNVASSTINLRPAVGIFSPTDGAVVKRPPVVMWSPVKKARFYNVQLWRGDAKVLTTWPRATKLGLRSSWSFSGKRQHLMNGRYRLFVWPAFGTPKKPGYGKLVGQVAFVVKR